MMCSLKLPHEDTHPDCDASLLR